MQMPDPESFDAFYARSVRSVTSEMRSLTGDPEEAEAAVREAYARAFQQWYEVSGYRDPETWLLDAAREAYRRRIGEGGVGGRPGRGPGRSGGQGVGAAGFGFGAAADGSPGERGQGLGQQTPGLDSATWAPATRREPVFGAHGGAAGPANTTSVLGRDGDAAAAGQYPRTGRPDGQPFMTGGRPRRGALIIVAAVVVIAAAVGGYLAFGHRSPQHVATGHGHTAKTTAKPKVKMLAAGKVGSRAAIPWSLVGPGWTLAELSTAQPNAAGDPSGGGTSALYLVDPKGGRYIVRNWSGVAPSLLAWSGDAKQALLDFSASGNPSYSLLTVASGQTTSLSLPPSVTVVGFTRPDGLALLAVQLRTTRFALQRYSLSGTLQATIGTLPHKAGTPAWEPGSCGSDCGALSSPDGLTDVWGTASNEMRLIENTGGLIRKLPVPGSGVLHACTPLSWWNSLTLVANCPAPGQPSTTSERLWLVPVNGSTPTPLTPGSGSPAGVGFNLSASQVGSSWYVTQTSANQCPSAPSGPGGLEIMQLASGGTASTVSVPDSTNYRNTVLAAVGTRMLVLAQTSCPGSYSLLSFDPSSGTSQVLLPAPNGELGVTAAVPFGTW
jgi:hypothetical protein